MARKKLKQEPGKVPDQTPNPKKKAYQDLIKNIPGHTKFEKFQYMRGMGFSEDQIMKSLNIETQNAFHLMDQRANDIVQNYLRYQAKTGHMQNLTNALVMQWKNVFALEKAADEAQTLRENNPEDPKYYYPESHFRTAYTNALKETVALQHLTPLADALNLFIKENIIEGTSNKRTSSKKMSIWPKDLKN